MRYTLAPLEGITDSVYRRAHHAVYPGAERYYTPFISTNQNHLLTPRDRREIAPENNAGIPLVPQLLGKNADDFLWAANTLADMGYSEVNLNLGCPSGTVTAKGKGSGFLRRPEELETFLDRVFKECPIGISIKTRIGYLSPDEFEPLCRLFAQYPVKELIIHPRTTGEQYTGPLHHECFEQAAALCGDIPLWYNGEIRSPADAERMLALHPAAQGVMVGRGLIAQPWMFSGPADKALLRKFHDRLCEEYPVVFGAANSAMHRMKAVWAYLITSFDNNEPFLKPLHKAKQWQDFLHVTDEIFQTCELKDTP